MTEMSKKLVGARSRKTLKRYIAEGIPKDAKSGEQFKDQVEEIVGVLIKMPYPTYILLATAVNVVNQNMSPNAKNKPPKQPTDRKPKKRKPKAIDAPAADNR